MSDLEAMIRRATSPADYLVRRRFPEYGQARQPPSFANQHPGINGPDPARLRAADAYMAELGAMPPAEVERLAAEERLREQEEQRQNALAADARLGFGAAWAAADFGHWSRCAYWSLDEALALMAGMEPGRISFMAITMAATSGASQAAVRFERMRDLAQRAKNAKLLADSNLPGVFLAWAKRSGIEYPAALEAAVTAHGVVITDWQSLYEQARDTAESWKAFAEENLEKVNQRIADLTAERDRLAQELEALRAAQTTTEGSAKPDISATGRKTLLLALYAVARKHYRFDPDAKRSDAARNLSHTLALYGIDITDETIRGWLKEGAALAPAIPEDGP